jgi:23S rRNA (pseudouridine1915-N3)-methyltransferase
VKLKVGWIGKTKEAAVQALTEKYLRRVGRYLPAEPHEFKSEGALLQYAERERTRPVLVLLDARGRQMSSEELAEFLRRQQDGGTQTLLFAVGPADGWSEQARRAADHVLSLSKMTLAHEIARVVLLEQLYRGFAILAGHPYHRGH